ncbi:MAG: hypothetical protein KF830_15205 [Planctomycetes bacterium]|nr:hypothetical protein [Planctomycetota bacterium]
MHAPHSETPEPEVRALTALARVGLLAVRALLALVGLAAIGGAVYAVFEPAAFHAEPSAVPPCGERIARSAVFVGMGLPLVLPAGWMFGRGRWAALALGLFVVAAPMPLEAAPAHGLLRALAVGVGTAATAVWQTLWRLHRA